MLRHEVVSSTIQTIGYKENTLFVRFNTGCTYSYSDVPFTVFITLQKAESVGRTFHHEVKGKYYYTKLDYDPFDKYVKAA